MQIVRLLRSCYDGDEHLVLYNDSYKRAKQLNPNAIGDFPDRLASRLHFFSKFSRAFLEPDFVDLNGKSPLLMFPYFNEKDGQDILADHYLRLEVAQNLVSTFESLHHISAEGFGVWGIQNLLFSDQLCILPPLWLNLKPNELKTIQEVSGLFVAPELLEGKHPTPRSDIYILGKILELLIPQEYIPSVQPIISRMTHGDPNQRPTHFAHHFQRYSFQQISFSSKTPGRREIAFPQTIERHQEVSSLLQWIETHQKKGMTSIMLTGEPELAKDQFMKSIENELRNSDWSVIESPDSSVFIKELVQLIENPEVVGLTMKELESLWNCDMTKPSEIPIPIVRMLFSIIPKIALWVPDWVKIDPFLLDLLKELQEHSANRTVLLFTAASANQSIWKFDLEYELQPFDRKKTKAIVENLFSPAFTLEHPDFPQWLFHVSGGYPTDLFDILQELSNQNMLTIQNNQWVLIGDFTTLDGFEKRINHSLSTLDSNTKHFISLLSCLSSTFDQTELDLLYEVMNLNSAQRKPFIEKAIDSGLIIKKTDGPYFFTLQTTWKDMYSALDPRNKTPIHKTLGQSKLPLSKKAWHHKNEGKTRTAIALYIRASRKAFFSEKKTQEALTFLHEGMDLIKPGVSRGSTHDFSFVTAYEAFLLTHLGISIPDGTIGILQEQPRFLPLLMTLLNQKRIFPQVIHLYETRKDGCDENRAHSSLSHYRILFEYAYALFKSGKGELSSNIAREILGSIHQTKAYFYRELQIRCYSLLMEIYHQTNNATQWYATMEKAVNIAEQHGFFYLLPQIYSVASQFLFIFDPISSKTLLNKAITVSKNHLSLYKASKPLLEMAYNSLYSGKITLMFGFLEQIRQMDKRFHDPEVIAEAYILESYFHSYNKQPQEALEDLDKAKKIHVSRNTQKRIARGIAIAHILNHQWESLEEYIRTFDSEYRWEYGFDNALAIYRSKTKKEIHEAFSRFRSENRLFVEEMMLGFWETLSRNIPEDYEAFLQTIIIDLTKDRLSLSLSLALEALAKHYYIQNQQMKAQKAFKRALNMYKNNGFHEAAKKLSVFFQGKEEYIEEDFYYISSIVSANPDPTSTARETVKRIEKTFYAQRVELEVLHEIINFSKTINSNAHAPDLLNEFTAWLATLVPFRKGIIFVSEGDQIVHHGSCFVNKDEIPALIEEVRNESTRPQRNPFRIKNEFPLDERKRVTLYFSNPSLSLNPEDFERIVLLTEELEPILSMAVRNSMSYRSSILDPLTRLYTRWFYQQRLDEEFEKAERYQFPLAIIMADIDHFKLVNDQFGHSKGDEVLRSIASIFRKICRRIDIIGRYGGEEFIVILPNTTTESAFQIAERLRLEVESMDEFPFRITMSFGIANTQDQPFGSAQSLIQSADSALFLAKNHGRNRVSSVCHTKQIP